jgi:hypothetical protein
VFNGLKMRGVLGGYRQGYGSGYGYGYGYGAGYSYGYGYTNDEKVKQSFALKVGGAFKRSNQK